MTKTTQRRPSPEAAALLERMNAHIASTEQNIAKARALLEQDALDAATAAVAETALADLEAFLARIRESRRQLLTLFGGEPA